MEPQPRVLYRCEIMHHDRYGYKWSLHSSIVLTSTTRYPLGNHHHEPDVAQRSCRGLIFPIMVGHGDREHTVESMQTVLPPVRCPRSPTKSTVLPSSGAETSHYQHAQLHHRNARIKAHSFLPATPWQLLSKRTHTFVLMDK